LRYDPFYGRLWTVYNLPAENHEIARKYGYRYLDEQVRKYIDSLQDYFWNIGLGELISIRKIDALDTVNVLIVFRFRYHWWKVFLYFILALLILIVSGAIITGLAKLLMLLIGLIF